MFEKFLRFFVLNSRMNYTLFILVFFIGIWSYMKMPKEIFPKFELDMISISGGYSGASVDILDKMAVSKIEDNVKSINGVTDTTSIISPGRFSIVLELQKGLNKYNLVNKVKDAVALTLPNLPSDMDEPTVKIIDRTKQLIDIALTSNRFSTDQMKEFASELKTKLLSVKGVSDITIFGDSDLYFSIILDDKKIDAYNLNRTAIVDAISKLSYIFPIGKIEDKQSFYISTYNGAKTAHELKNTLIKISNNYIYLKDIANIEKTYKDSATLYSFDGKPALKLSISQTDNANALQIAKDIKSIIKTEQQKQKDIKISISDDNSQKITERLNIVGSNITFGIILIALLVALLINSRMAFIIILGIPTSFVIAAAYMYMLGYSINLISLIGVLIAIGIVVDDAIVVSENIQQHIQEGYEPKEAAILGAKEMFLPVTIASLTTLFAFLPSLMISGTMGEVIKLIPIALSALVVASLIETFVFLPIHAAHTLKSDTPVTSWTKANKIYSAIIHFFMRYRKTFLLLFIILVPLLTIMMIKTSKFQLFPKFDATNIKISIKANQNSTLKESFDIVKNIEKDLLKHKNDWYIKSIDSVAGYRIDGGSNTEKFPYVMFMTLQLKDKAQITFVDKYITPYLSFYYEEEGRVRIDSSQEIANKLRNFLKQQDYIKKYNLQELTIIEKKVGPIKADVKIGLVSHDNALILESIKKIKKELSKIDGIKTIQDSVKLGLDEIKLKINNYGKELGITEQYIGSYLANLYLDRKISVSFDDKEMLDIKLKSLYKDNIHLLKDIQIPLTDGKKVLLKDICDFITIKSFEQIIKDNGEKNFYLYANVDPKKITASEVLEKLEPLLNSIKQNGVKIILKGEAQKNKELARDMKFASFFALTLILLSMLYLFNSFRDTFIVMSVIPFSFLGVLIGHKIMGLHISMPTLIGALGLAGVVINDGIIMMDNLKKSKTLDDIFKSATRRFRPIILTTITTLIGMSSLIFFPTGQAVIFQPIAIALGFGLAWGTILNLIYLPVIYTIANKIK